MLPSVLAQMIVSADVPKENGCYTLVLITGYNPESDAIALDVQLSWEGVVEKVVICSEHVAELFARLLTPGGAVNQAEYCVKCLFEDEADWELMTTEPIATLVGREFVSAF